MKRITDKMRMDYLEQHDIAVESHDEREICYCVSVPNGLWQKAKTLRESCDAAIKFSLESP